MILLCCLCVCLVIGGWVYHRPLGAAVAALRLSLFGARVRVPAGPAVPLRRERAARPQLGHVPPPRVATRHGGGP